MGLDMYLTKYPAYKDVSPKQAVYISEYINWKNNPDAKKCTFKEWCGMDEIKINQDVWDFYEKNIETKYWAWDKEKRHPHQSFFTEIAYWRKANMIHNWFVEHCQDGIDECQPRYSVSKEQLEELLNDCITIRRGAKLIDDKIVKYKTIEKGEIVTKERMSKKVANHKLCEKLLPAQGGFFFGDTSYDEFYIEGIKDTIKQLEQVLEETDFDKEVVFYQSSW